MMKKAFVFVLCFSFLLTGCGYNKLQALDEKIEASWSEVVNQYQRRAELLPNLMMTVKGYAKHENDIFSKISDAQQAIGSIKIDTNMINDPVKMQKYQQAQGELSNGLSRLIAISNQYPEIKANTSFNNLMTQLEGTENRIATARKRYIDAVREYNTLVRQFPSNLTAKIFGMEKKANFSVENEKSISSAPQIQF